MSNCYGYEFVTFLNTIGDLSHSDASNCLLATLLDDAEHTKLIFILNLQFLGFVVQRFFGHVLFSLKCLIF